jgi:cold shock CspA family protein
MNTIKAGDTTLGKVELVSDRGYGYITPDDSSRNIFFHAKDLNGVEFNDLRLGDLVTFEPVVILKDVLRKARRSNSISFIPILERETFSTIGARLVFHLSKSDDTAKLIAGRRDAHSLLTKLESKWRKRPLQLLEFQEALEGSEHLTIFDRSNSAAQARFELSSVTEISQHLIDQLKKHPEGLYEISDSKFEELVAELYRREGYTAAWTGKGSDGGKDILVSRNDGFTSCLYYVECKKHAPDNPVGVEVVKKLHATVLGDRCNGGIVVTTAKRFTKPAMDFSGKVNNNHHVTLLNLKPYQELLGWIIGAK